MGTWITHARFSMGVDVIEWQRREYMPRQMFLTPVQNIAINLIFGVMNESRYNRTLSEYAAMPPNFSH
jgi:hypothetical protein